MKYLLFIITLISFTSCSTSKSLDLKANKFSFREKVNDEWSPFTDWDSTDVTIQIKNPKLLFKKTTITIFDSDTLSYKVLQGPIESTTENGEEVLSFNCIDNDKAKCHIIMVNRGETINMVVYYSNLNLCYNIIDKK
jgi:hypothetical protein